MDKNKTRNFVREVYGKIAESGAGNTCGCGCNDGPDTFDFARSIGYSVDELKVIPDEANLGLSCGNPTALAALGEGEIVLDLGSGAGFDCFLAAARVGATGKVIGVDMTAAMIDKARENARLNNIDNVDFRLGEIEALPVADNSVDAVISNCVINLSIDKAKAFEEMKRVLKPGGRIAISDIALLKEIPESWKSSIEAYTNCVSGAVLVDEYRKTVESAGLKDVRIATHDVSACFPDSSSDPFGKAVMENIDDLKSIDKYITSVYVEALK